MSVKLEFKNRDAFEREITIECAKASINHIVMWYNAFYSGDNYELRIDGVQVEVSRNGDILQPEVLS